MVEKFTTHRATKVAAGGFPVAVGCRRTIELTLQLGEIVGNVVRRLSLGVVGGPSRCSRLCVGATGVKCGYPERFAQQALGHNSKMVHHS
jgi:hypothetical protein